MANVINLQNLPPQDIEVTLDNIDTLKRLLVTQKKIEKEISIIEAKRDLTEAAIKTMSARVIIYDVNVTYEGYVHYFTSEQDAQALVGVLIEKGVPLHDIRLERTNDIDYTTRIQYVDCHITKAVKPDFCDPDVIFKNYTESKNTVYNRNGSRAATKPVTTCVTK